MKGAVLKTFEADGEFTLAKALLLFSTDACEFVGAFVPFDLVLFAMRLQNILDDVLQRVGSYQASGGARVDEESMDDFAFD